MKPVALTQAPAGSSGGMQDVQDVQKKLAVISEYQQQATKSLLAFGKRIRIKSDQDRDNAIKRLKSASPPGWRLTTRVRQRQVTVFGMHFEEKARRVEQRIQQLDKINSLTINNDERLSHFLGQQVVIPFKSQYWFKGCRCGIASESVAVELCGCSWSKGRSILDQLEAVMGLPILRLGAKSEEKESTPGCGKRVWDLLKQVKKEGLFCRVIAINGNDHSVRASELFQEIREQFEGSGHKAIVIVLSKEDGGVPDLGRSDKVERYWFDCLKESKSIAKSLQLQAEAVVALNEIASKESDKGADVASAIAAYKTPNGWRIATGRLDGYTQITSLQFDVMNEALDAIEPLTIPDNTELQKFMNENVVIPFKNQQAYQACGLLDKVMVSVLCGSTIARREKLLDNLRSTLQHPLYLFPAQGDDTAEDTNPVKSWLDSTLAEAKFVSLDCIVLAIEADLLKPEISVPTLLSTIKRAVTSAGLRAIVLFMGSGNIAFDELPSDIKRFDFDPAAKVDLEERTRWHLLNGIRKCCSDHGKDFESVDWKNAIKALFNDISKDPASSRGGIKNEIEELCTDKAKAFFANLMHYCASHGLSQISQDAIEGALREPAEKQFRKLERRVEDFVLPGQSSLTKFFRSHVIEHLCNPENFARYGLCFPESFLLSGPPGTGKTHALKQLAEFTELAFFEMNPGTVGSSYVDGCEQKMEAMFREAEEKKGAIIMIDEIDSMLPARDDIAHHNVKRTNELLRHIEEARKKRILVVGTTNRLDALDPAAIRNGRIGKIVEVGGLTRDEVTELLEANLEGFCQEDTLLDFTAVLNTLGENRLVADVYGFCGDLRMFAARQKVYPLTQEILNQYLLSGIHEQRRPPRATLTVKPSGQGNATCHLVPGER